ncbi:MAG: DUF2089 domain-containing protein [bacterium]|nr:DUF2089 domain-containing protein [bacterium]
MKKNIQEISSCPFCNGEIFIKEVECSHCHTEIRGHFRPNRFNLFSKEQLYFIEVFLKNEGNIKLVEKDLGISYPTVKSKLQKITGILGYRPQENKEESEEKSKERIILLKQLQDGKSNVDEILKKLGELK